MLLGSTVLHKLQGWLLCELVATAVAARAAQQLLSTVVAIKPLLGWLLEICAISISFYLILARVQRILHNEEQKDAEVRASVVAAAVRAVTRVVAAARTEAAAGQLAAHSGGVIAGARGGETHRRVAVAWPRRELIQISQKSAKKEISQVKKKKKKKKKKNTPETNT
eukprot:TRINITY_DN3639_c0_g1_i1.p1 TRINITY_DN3639_c0_g1~~TRINITY_DN3639_c0_g1_i1.p1  ORF type:complete len:167 (-),score=44.15 TRINITY_DN3639_c0_g1_i1:79-579(-)